MLEKERNEILMNVGAETPMGKLLRRYWMPIGAVSEFDDKATKPIKLMGEDLVLYKDKSDTFGLISRHCPHRRVVTLRIVVCVAIIMVGFLMKKVSVLLSLLKIRWILSKSCAVLSR